MNEFRIGNLVETQAGNTIACDFSTLEAINYRRGIYNPFAITEELLLKFGADIWGHISTRMASIKINDETEIQIDLVNGDVHLCYDEHIAGGEYANIPLKIKYIHELQNFYFSFTKEELIFKP